MRSRVPPTPLRARVLHLRRLNLLSLLLVARQAERAAVSIGQDNFSILGGLVTSTVMSLLLLPALIWRYWRPRAAGPAGVSAS